MCLVAPYRPLGASGPRPEYATLNCADRGGRVAEVVLALSATVDGSATAHWLADQLRPLGVLVTKLAQGVPMGGALDVLDEGTLAAALRARRPT